MHGNFSSAPANTILLVDRDEQFGQVLRRVLKGRVIFHARNASAGLRLADEQAPQLALVNSHLPDAILGVLYNTTITSTGGVGPVTWSVSAGTLMRTVEVVVK